MIYKQLVRIFLLITVCVGFSSCSNDDDDPKVGLDQILVGEWDSEFLGDLSDIDIKSLDVNDTHLNSVDSHLVFNSNGKGYEIDKWDGTKTEFSYKVSGNALQMTAGSVRQSTNIIKYSDRVVYGINEYEQSVLKMVKVK